MPKVMLMVRNNLPCFFCVLNLTIMVNFSYKPNMANKLIIKPNGYYEGIIKSLYSGTEGEVVTFMQEFYQENLVYPFEKAQYEFLKKLRLDDMEHAKRLAQILVIMGSDPRYLTPKNVWLTGRNIDYVKSFKQILYTNLELKEKVIIDYKTAIAKIEDKNINLILALNLEDEILHKNMILRQIEKI